jgi:acyl-CoA synthetase (AMP-forming)/AMP-acid ligase II
VNLSGLIDHHAERFGERVAFSAGEASLTYGDLHLRTRETAGALAERGVRRGDVVGVLLYNCLEFIDLMCACAHVGAIFMPLNWRLTGPELSYIVEHSGARVLVSEPELEDRLDAFRPDATGCVGVRVGDGDGTRPTLAELVAATEPVVDPAPVLGDDVMRLMYTSGTTSRPKGVMITYANLYWKCAAQVVALQLTGLDRGLACGPLYHVGALDLTTTNMLYVGASTHVLHHFEVPAVLAAMEEQQITNVWLAPTMVNAIMNHPEVGDYDLSSMRLVVDGGEKMPLPLIQRIGEIFPNAWFADAYGLTETVSGDTFLDKGRLIDKLGSVGTPIPHTEVGIVDADDRPLPAGERGEIVVRGPKVSPGYWKDPEATAASRRDGWLHTGDLGVFDEDGYLYIVDRLKDMILSGGENIASLEVERAVYEHPDVLEVAVVGSPHPKWNEVPVAYIVLREDSSVGADDLDPFCRERLAGYKTPKAFRFVDALPRNPSGKILKRALRELERTEVDQ